MYNVDRTTKNQRWKYNTLIWRIIVTFVFCLQASERCHGMALSSYMLKPVQRIPSYRLLLIGELNFLLLRAMIKFFFAWIFYDGFFFPDYLKHLPKDSEESKDTEGNLKDFSQSYIIVFCILFNCIIMYMKRLYASYWLKTSAFSFHSHIFCFLKLGGKEACI